MLKIIAVEGLDYSGKSTLIGKLKALLLNRGFNVVTYRQPGGTPRGEEIRAQLMAGVPQEEELRLFLESHAAMVEDIKGLAQDADDPRSTVVLIDRWLGSAWLYQCYTGINSTPFFIHKAKELIGDFRVDTVLRVHVPHDELLERRDGRGTDHLDEVALSKFDALSNGFNSASNDLEVNFAKRFVDFDNSGTENMLPLRISTDNLIDNLLGDMDD